MLSRCSGRRVCKSLNENVHIRRSWVFIYPHSISIKFNSQWNLGKKSILHPKDSAVSSNQHLSTLKSSHRERIRLAQHRKLSAGGLFSLQRVQSSFRSSDHNFLKISTFSCRCFERFDPPRRITWSCCHPTDCRQNTFGAERLFINKILQYTSISMHLLNLQLLNYQYHQEQQIRHHQVSC